MRHTGVFVSTRTEHLITFEIPLAASSGVGGLPATVTVEIIQPGCPFAQEVESHDTLLLINFSQETSWGGEETMWYPAGTEIATAETAVRTASAPDLSESQA